MIARVALLDLMWFGVVLVLWASAPSRWLRVLAAMMLAYVLLETFAHRLMEDGVARLL